MDKRLLPRIAELYELLRRGPNYLQGAFEAEEDKDAAIDLFEHETLMTPAAWKMLNGFQTLHPLDRAALQKPILFGTRLLRIPDGKENEITTREIGHLEDVLRHAQVLEELRQVCHRCMTES